MALERLEIQERVREEAVANVAASRTVGVVFVHGVGEQEQTFALREHAGPLVKWLRSWYEQRPRDDRDRFDVVSSHLSYGETTGNPSSIVVHLPAQADGSGGEWSPENWVLTEGWWAARLRAPNLQEMTTWTLKVFWYVLLRLRSASRPLASNRSLLARSVEATSGALLVTGYTVGAVLGMPVVVALFLLAQLPIGWVEQLALRALRPFLLEGIGDFYVYLYDDIQAKHVRRGVVEAVRWLKTKHRCEHVVVVAHSQGTVVAFDALGRRATSNGLCVHDDLALQDVRALVTVGAALGNAWRKGIGPVPPRRLTDKLCEHVRWVDAWTAYDFVNGGELKLTESDLDHPMPNDNVGITNWQNMLTDHGAYFDNRDEYVPLLAQIIESPHAWSRSRFWQADGLDRQWVVRRRDRVTTLVGWRLWAMLAFGLAVIRRATEGLLPGDGELVRKTIADVPALGELAKTIASIFAAAPASLHAGFDFVLAMVVWAGLCGVVYIAITRVVFDPWSEREMKRAAGPGKPAVTQRWSIIVRTLAVVPAIAAAALGVAVARVVDPGFGDWVAIGALLLLWWIVWGLAMPQRFASIEAVDTWFDERDAADAARREARLGRAPA